MDISHDFDHKNGTLCGMPYEPMSYRGVYRLAGAVLLQAIQDASSSSIRRRGSALRWMNGDQSGYSFSLVCKVLNRDPEKVRRFCERKAAERRNAEPRFYATPKQAFLESPTPKGPVPDHTNGDSRLQAGQ